MGFAWTCGGWIVGWEHGHSAPTPTSSKSVTSMKKRQGGKSNSLLVLDKIEHLMSYWRISLLNHFNSFRATQLKPLWPLFSHQWWLILALWSWLKRAPGRKNLLNNPTARSTAFHCVRFSPGHTGKGWESPPLKRNALEKRLEPADQAIHSWSIPGLHKHSLINLLSLAQIPQIWQNWACTGAKSAFVILL